jgi:tetratricopeptide (TPR) repeat protein
MKIFFTYIVISLSLIAFSQNVEFKKKNFESEQDFNSATEALEAGDDYFFVGNFEKALPRFKDAQQLNANNALLNFKIGACYLKIDEIEKSMPFFEKAKQLDPKVDPKIDFALAQSYQANGRFEDAVNSYNNYLLGLSKNKKILEEEVVQKELDICNTEIQKSISKQEEVAELKEEVVEVKQEAPVAKETPKETVTEFPENDQKPTEPKPVEVKKENKLAEEPKAVTKPTPVKTVEKKADPKTELAASTSNDKITYRIQISSTTMEASKEDLAKIYQGPLKISHQKVGVMYKYFIGDFDNKNEALKAKSLSGIADAFIVKFKNGKKF